MHGFVLSQMKRFVDLRFGHDAWPALVHQAGIPTKTFENFREYPDDEAVALVVAASVMTGKGVPEILESFGSFLGGALLKIYAPVIDRRWKTVDFLEHVEATIHHVVRTRNRNAKPPVLSATRLGPDEVLIVYRSARKLCPLARGIVSGVAEHYGESVAISEDACQHEGAEACRIRVVASPH